VDIVSAFGKLSTKPDQFHFDEFGNGNDGLPTSVNLSIWGGLTREY
jgi:hypothetical protein